jgi:hypothetical protein
VATTDAARRCLAANAVAFEQLAHAVHRVVLPAGLLWAV